MSLDFDLICPHCHQSFFSRNITHNLHGMADACGIYGCLWHPDDRKYLKDDSATLDYPVYEKASQLIPLLEEGLNKLKSNPEFYKSFEAPNGWGKYEHFVEFVEAVLQACKQHPDAKPDADR